MSNKILFKIVILLHKYFMLKYNKLTDMEMYWRPAWPPIPAII